ncbi:MAG: helix-turn-helix domain-containing protein [Pseudohongiellaceae bacterium]
MNLIKQLREATGCSQSDLAVAARTSQPTIAAYESGRKSPTLRTLERLVSALGLQLVVDFVPPMSREDRRSLAFHRAIAEKVRLEPRCIILASDNLEKLLELHPGAQALLEEWDRWLQLSSEQLLAEMLSPSPKAREMRHISPFSGILSAQERVQILEDFRKEEAHEKRTI